MNAGIEHADTGANSVRRKGINMPTLETIKDMPMFKHFTATEKKTFAEIDHSLLGFSKDDIIIKQGEECSSLYLLVIRNRIYHQIRAFHTDLQINTRCYIR